MPIALLAPVLLVLGGIILYLTSRAEGALTPNLEPPDRDLRGSGLPDAERAEILAVAESFGIDPRLLAALRKTENGGPGREFGVLSVSAPTYHDQATIAARSIRNSIERYESAAMASAVESGRLTDDFINFFSARYAPIGAGNDPNALNQYHAGNLKSYYRRIDYA